MKLFIFGSTGDLVIRNVLPALQSLLLKDLEVWALGRKEFTDEIYKDFACKECSIEFKKILKYYLIDFEKEDLCDESCINLFNKKQKNFVYISLPPKMIKKILISISKLKKYGFDIAVLIEKPFGKDLKNARELKNIIEKERLEDNIYLSDHYLFKKNIINLNDNFEKLKIVSIEKVGLEGRSYYDEIGALKDMVQSHFFNIVFKLIKNPQKEFKSFKILEFEKAQYIGYREELGHYSKTETFIKLKIKTSKKVIEFITGKAFDKKINFIVKDKVRIEIDSIKEDPYSVIFNEFFSLNRDNFPTIDNAILAWRIIEKIELKKPKLDYYPKNSDFNNFDKVKF